MFSSNIRFRRGYDGKVTHVYVKLILPVFINIFMKDKDYEPAFKIKANGKNLITDTWFEKDVDSNEILIPLRRHVTFERIKNIEIYMSILRNPGKSKTRETFVDSWYCVGGEFVSTGPIVVTGKMKEIVDNSHVLSKI